MWYVLDLIRCTSTKRQYFVSKKLTVGYLLVIYKRLRDLFSHRIKNWHHYHELFKSYALVMQFHPALPIKSCFLDLIRRNHHFFLNLVFITVSRSSCSSPSIFFMFSSMMLLIKFSWRIRWHIILPLLIKKFRWDQLSLMCDSV